MGINPVLLLFFSKQLDRVKLRTMFARKGKRNVKRLKRSKEKRSTYGRTH